MAKLNEDTKAVIKQLELLGVVNLNTTKKMGLFEKQKVKVTNAITKCNDDQRAKRRTS